MAEVATGDYEMYYAKLQSLKKLKSNLALFGRHCFPTAFRLTS